MPRGCSDAPGWRSFLGQSCGEYADLGWCRGGRLHNASAGGSLLGAPERACCACGGGSMLRPSARDDTLRQAVFFATHELDDTDVRLVRHYVADLASRHLARLFILVFRKESSQPLTAAELEAWRAREAASGAEIFLWNEGGLRRLFPHLGSALASSKSLAHTPRAFNKYFFFHASLLLWDATFGGSYPSLAFMWRMEADALFAGPLSRMVDLASAVHVDVLLPHIERQQQNPTWPHWRRNEAILAGVPPEKRLMSLVPIGRYSRSFLNGTMAHRWAAGRIGYEEITIPTTCATSQTACSMESMHVTAKIRSAKRCVYRPVWNCSDYLRARQQRTNELWHPVKDRTCLVEWLDRGQ